MAHDRMSDSISRDGACSYCSVSEENGGEEKSPKESYNALDWTRL